jgi:hypothetical protein
LNLLKEIILYFLNKNLKKAVIKKPVIVDACAAAKYLKLIL